MALERLQELNRKAFSQLLSAQINSIIGLVKLIKIRQMCMTLMHSSRVSRAGLFVNGQNAHLLVAFTCQFCPF